MMLACAEALEVKKLEAGFALWKVRMGAADLKADFEAATMVELSWNGRRMKYAILYDYLQIGRAHV